MVRTIGYSRLNVVLDVVAHPGMVLLVVIFVDSCGSMMSILVRGDGLCSQANGAREGNGYWASHFHGNGEQWGLSNLQVRFRKEGREA